MVTNAETGIVTKLNLWKNSISKNNDKKELKI